MKLTVNSKETEVKDGCTVAELSTFLALPEKGIAIAVNNHLSPILVILGISQNVPS